MSKKVFLNTSPIQYIHQLGLIRIIKELFGKVYVPAEVHEELNRGREEGIELPYLEGMDFIEIMEPKAISFSKLVRDLGKGETAVILLGRRIQVAWLSWMTFLPEAWRGASK